MTTLINTPEGAINFTENKDGILISVKSDVTLANTSFARMSEYSNLDWEIEYTNMEEGNSCVLKVLPGSYPYYCVNHPGQKPTWGQIEIG